MLIRMLDSERETRPSAGRTQTAVELPRSLSLNDSVALYSATAEGGGGYADVPAYYDATVSA